MSTETIAIIISTVTLLLGFVSAFGWMIHRTDARIDRVEHGLGARIDRVEHGLGTRIDRVEHGLGARIDRVEHELEDLRHELVEVKIAVARIEGPRRQLLTAR